MSGILIFAFFSLGAIVVCASPMLEYKINNDYFKKHGRWPWQDYPDRAPKQDMRTQEQKLADIDKSIDATYKSLNDTWTWR